MKLAVGLFVVISGASLAGTLMPQEAANRAIYGSLWFIILLGLLLLNALACVLRRKVTPKNAGSFIMHLGVPVIMAGAITGIITGFSGEVMLAEGQGVDKIKGVKKEISLPFTLRLEKFCLDRHPVKARHFISSRGETGGWKRHEFEGAGSVINVEGIDADVKIIALFPDFVMGEDRKPATRSDDWNNPAAQIDAGDGPSWLFSKYSDFHGTRTWGGVFLKYECEITGGGIKEFRSDVSVVENGKVKLKKTVKVNDPLKYRGYTVYQASYDEKTLKSSGFIVKKDPGVPVVYAGFLLLCLGMAIRVYEKLKQGA